MLFTYRSEVSFLRYYDESKDCPYNRYGPSLSARTINDELIWIKAQMAKTVAILQNSYSAKGIASMV